MSRSRRIENVTRGVLLAERAELAQNPWRRLKGLLGRAGLKPGEGLVLRPCQAIHTWFMSFPIDVLHVDSGSHVCRVLTEVPPNRLGPFVLRSRYVVELPAGTVRASGTEVGDQLALT